MNFSFILQNDLFKKLNTPFEKSNVVKSVDLVIGRKYTCKLLRGAQTQWGCKLVVDIDDPEIEGSLFLPARYLDRFEVEPEDAKGFKVPLTNTYITKTGVEPDRYATPIYQFGQFPKKNEGTSKRRAPKHFDDSETQFMESQAMCDSDDDSDIFEVSSATTSKKKKNSF